MNGRLRKLTLLAALVSPATQALTVDEYSRLSQQQSGAAQSYMAGVADALSAIRNSERGSALACVPNDIRFSSDQVAQQYRKYLDTYPQIRQHLTPEISVADVVLGAYAEQYCGRPGGGATNEEQTPYPLAPLPPQQ